MPAVLSKLEFAKSQGWAPSYVSKLAKEGRLVLTDDGRVNVPESLARIAQTAAGTHPGVVERFARERAAKNGAEAAQGEPAAGDSDQPEEKLDMVAPAGKDLKSEDGRLAVRKYRELIGNEDRKIDLGLLRGELLMRGEADHRWHDLGVALRAGLEATFERLTPRLAASTTREAVGEAIGHAMRDERRRVKRELISALRQVRVHE